MTKSVYILRAIFSREPDGLDDAPKVFSQFIMDRNIRANSHSVVILNSAQEDARSVLFHPARFLLYVSIVAFSLLLQMTSATARAQSSASETTRSTTSAFASFPSSKTLKKRVIALRRKETAEGARLTLTSDAQLDDYSSYVEGERLFVLVPSTILAGAPGSSDAGGRIFTDLRVESRGDDLLLSLRLQMGESVYVRQQFNRLEVGLNTNERVFRN